FLRSFTAHSGVLCKGNDRRKPPLRVGRSRRALVRQAPGGRLMEKVWLKSYPEGVPAEIDAGQLRSLKELVEVTCAEHADSVAYVQMGKSITYRELDQLSRDFGAWLQMAGFKKGDRFAIMMPNTLQYPIALFGALRAGLAVVNTNPLYTAPELEHQLAD